MPDGSLTYVHTSPDARRVPAALAMLLLLAPAILVLSPPAFAGPMTSYNTLPSEHDDQGRSSEPDLQATQVLGPVTRNCVLYSSDSGFPRCVRDDLLPPAPPGRSAELAPGCTDDAGRQVSGRCGLWTLGGSLLGTPGMSGSAAPGRFSATKATQFRFLDVHMDQQDPATGSRFELNAKLGDGGGFAALATVSPDHGSPFVAGPTSVWAWYGNWTDKNGNGVIDHLSCGNDCVTPANEFVWAGQCRDHLGAVNPSAIAKGYCKVPFGGPIRIVGWAYPGGHNAFQTPDAPLLASTCTGAGTPAVQCTDPVGKTQGDTLLENPGVTTPDWFFPDRSGDPDPQLRGWHLTEAYPVYYYDHSVITTLITVGIVNPGSATGTPYYPSAGQHIDVDRYTTWAPAFEKFLNTFVKPTMRTTWCFAPAPPGTITPKC
jgi:hypothetical protein